ncbi:trypsin 5G1-like [Chrysoperla carnea]|uniref:trypsin 5G1-like n=1 Tax=Chrysoperla carnea TaxID=189513 RepID=UPI001D087B05|nr:trypsin 5G1-like [Chrysoperla carnea]
MFRLLLLALCCVSLISCSPSKHYVVKLDGTHPVAERNTRLQIRYANFASIENRIINGTDDPPNEDPWVARIIYHYDVSDGYIHVGSDCGGSLISPYWVLSARHCFYDEKEQTKLTSNKWWVSVGNVDFFVGQIIPVVEIHTYNSISNADDIAVLKLEHDANGIQPIPIQYEDNIDYSFNLAAIYGWGRTQSSTFSEILQVAYVSLLGPNICAKNKICFDPTITDTNACIGDSGGPMVHDQSGKLIGISKAVSVTNDQLCTGHITYYTSTAYYGTFIQNLIG